jgi:hypothetical protein
MPRWVKDILIAALIICGGIYLLLVIGSTSPRVHAPAQTSGYSSVAVGSEGQLHSGSSVIPVAVDEELLPELKRVVENNDPNGFESLSGPVFLVADATPVRVSESGAGGLRVSILAGTQKGRSGWVPLEWVKPSNP